MIRPSILVILALCILAMGGSCLWFAVDGLVSGMVEYPTKYAQRVISITDSPKTYWGCVFFWTAAGVALTYLSVLQLREIRR
jgi:hypothetical protein